MDFIKSMYAHRAVNWLEALKNGEIPRIFKPEELRFRQLQVVRVEISTAFELPADSTPSDFLYAGTAPLWTPRHKKGGIRNNGTFHFFAPGVIWSINAKAERHLIWCSEPKIVNASDCRTITKPSPTQVTTRTLNLTQERRRVLASKS